MKELDGDVVLWFKNLTGHEPYPHQIETYEALTKGKSVILRATDGEREE